MFASVELRTRENKKRTIRNDEDGEGRGMKMASTRFDLFDDATGYRQTPRPALRKRTPAGEFLHWTKVAAEVARISPRAEMKLAEVRAIVNDELRRNGGKEGSAR